MSQYMLFRRLHAVHHTLNLSSATQSPVFLGEVASPKNYTFGSLQNLVCTPSDLHESCEVGRTKTAGA